MKNYGAHKATNGTGWYGSRSNGKANKYVGLFKTEEEALEAARQDYIKFVKMPNPAATFLSLPVIAGCQETVMDRLRGWRE